MQSPLDLTPDQFRALGYQAIDHIAARLDDLQQRRVPVRQPVPPDLRERLMHAPFQEPPADPSALIDQIVSDIFPYPMGNTSSAFFAWVNSPPAPIAILGDLLAAAHNPSVAGGDHAAIYLEHGVLNGFKSMFGLPADAGGLIVSGGSVANLVPLGVMRHVKTGGRDRAHGLYDQPRLIVYTSAQGHSCIQKAVEVLGLGDENLRRIPVDGDFRMDVAALRARIAADRADGFMPACVVASAGTVNTGAIDPLDALADVCAEEGLWFHVDGAYGGVGILDPVVSALYRGIERADSLAVDPHKWMYVPVECGLALVRDAAAMRAAYSVIPPYLREDRAMPWFSEFGIQQTRGFKALKLWLTMQSVGLDGYRAAIAHDNAMARALQARIAAHPDFELVAAGPLSITCFRCVPANQPALDEAALDDLQRVITRTVQAEGRAFLTTTELDGRAVLRACIVNFRTDARDLETLLDALADAGARALA